MRDASNIVRIEIETFGRFRPLESLYNAATQIAVIGVGSVLESEAMQWSGFIMLVLFLLLMMYDVAAHNRGLMSIAEARAMLDKIEAKEVRR